MPGYVYFNHSIHLNAGIGCVSCHGQINSIKKDHGLEDLEVKYLWELVADCMIV